MQFFYASEFSPTRFLFRGRDGKPHLATKTQRWMLYVADATYNFIQHSQLAHVSMKLITYLEQLDPNKLLMLSVFACRICTGTAAYSSEWAAVPAFPKKKNAAHREIAWSFWPCDFPVVPAHTLRFYMRGGHSEWMAAPCDSAEQCVFTAGAGITVIPAAACTGVNRGSQETWS